MEVGPGLKSGVRIRMDNPAQLGGELLCAAVGALQTHKPPLLVMNMDTAATLVAVDAEGSIVGGVILPSPALSFRPWYATQPNCRRLIWSCLPSAFWAPTQRTACTAVL